MWAVVTNSGDVITERECPWPDLDPDLKIVEFRYRDRRGAVGCIHGYDSYGFQRYSLTSPDGRSLAHAGTQIICVLGDAVTVLDINETTGDRGQRSLPLSDLTYTPTLLRQGVME